MADQAAGNNEVHIQLRLKQTDAKILQAIDEALMRIEKGTFGICTRLRRADCRGAAQRHSLDARLHHLQRKAEGVTRATDPRRTDPRLLSRARRPADAPRGRRRSSSPTTTSTTPTSTSSRASRRTCRGCSTRCSISARRSSADPSRGPVLSAQGRCVEGAGRRRRAAATRSSSRSGAPQIETVTQRAPQGHAEGDSRRDARAQAPVRSGRERPHRI